MSIEWTKKGIFRLVSGLRSQALGKPTLTIIDACVRLKKRKARVSYPAKWCRTTTASVVRFSNFPNAFRSRKATLFAESLRKEIPLLSILELGNGTVHW